MRTALYARVSTDMQAEKGYSIEAQLDKLRAYCALHDISDYEEYVDAGYSASTLDRPEMNRLVQDIKLSLIETVIVYKLDRLSRKTKDTLYLVEDVFIKHNVTFISLSESIDTSTSSGKFFLSILSSVAQLERENIRERGMLGMKKKAQLGYKSRTPKILIGYDYDEKNKKYVINDYEAMQVREIFDRYLKGESLGSIFRYFDENYTTKFGKWKTVRNIQHVLDNESYTGKFVYQKTYVNGVNIPAIIDAEIFAKVKEIRDYKKANYHRHTASYLLTGLLFCGECGSRLRGYPKSDKKTFYYVCYNRDRSHPHMKKNQKCTLPYFRYDKLNSAVLDALKKIVSKQKYFDSVSKKQVNHEVEIETLEREIKNLSAKSNRIVDLLIEAEIDKETFTERLLEINKQKEALIKKLEILKSEQHPQNTMEYAEVRDMVATLENAEMNKQRELLSKLIHKITVFADNKIEIEWRF